MPFDLDTYLNSYPDNTEYIILVGKDLTELPDLSRFTFLKKLFKLF
jgi:hypothetical protein